MTITTEELASIRAIAEADKNGADGMAWDEAITPDIVIALCDRIEEQQDALRLLDMELSAVRNALEATELEAYLLEQSNLWIAAVAFDGTASDYGSLYGLVEAAHEAVRGRQMNEHALNGLDAGLEQRQWEIGAIVEHLREMKERCGQERYQCLLDSAVNELLYVDDSLMTIRKMLEESCPKN